MSTLTLSDADRRFVGIFRQIGILEDIDGHLLRGNHTAAVACPDCHQLGDIFDHHRTVCGLSPHLIGLNGGALLIPTSSPLPRAKTEGRVIIENLVEAIQMKGLDKIVLYAHAPCGKAAAAGIGFRDTIAFLIAAKKRLKRSRIIQTRLADKKLTLLPFVHVCYSEGRRKTYFVNRARWEAYRKKEGTLEDGVMQALCALSSSG